MTGRSAVHLAGARAGLGVSLLMVVGVFVGPGTSAAADGPQSPPSLVPTVVQAAADPFSVVPPADARCEEDGESRSGVDGWRWHGFIVEAGRDLSTLEFGPTGPGDDYDASDGTITAGLISAGRGIWNEPPAEQPKGLIDPGGLGDVVLDPSDYTLADGRYLIGFACSDDQSATRQWWTLEVTVQTGAAPFLAAASDEAVPADASATTPTTAAGSDSPRSLSTSQGGSAPLGVGAETAAEAGQGSGAARPSGISWSPLVALGDASSVLPVEAWAAMAVVFARITYLLARPVRLHPALSP